MRLLLVASLLFAPAVQADSQLQVTEVHQPEAPAWGTNTAHVTIHNSGPAAGQVTIAWQSTNTLVKRGWGYDDKVSVSAGETKTLTVEFIIPAFPGKVTHRLRIRDAADDTLLWERTTEYEFPFANAQTAALKIPPRLQEAFGFSRGDYPRLRMEQRGRLVIYYLDGDAWVQSRIDAIAEERSQICRELAAKINPKFESEIAIYLFPDADSKLAYTNHRGMGWATGNILVEIYNPRERIDPYHEVTHIIAGSIGSPPAMLDEGLAAWSQEGHRWNGIAADSWAKAFAVRGVLWPVETLLSFPEIGTEASRAEIAYPESASLVGYLVERLGWEKFLAGYRALKRKSDSAAFAKAFGIGLDEVEKDWLGKLSAPEITPAPESKITEALAKHPAQSGAAKE